VGSGVCSARESAPWEDGGGVSSAVRDDEEAAPGEGTKAVCSPRPGRGRATARVLRAVPSERRRRAAHDSGAGRQSARPGLRGARQKQRTLACGAPGASGRSGSCMAARRGEASDAVRFRVRFRALVQRQRVCSVCGMRDRGTRSGAEGSGQRAANSSACVCLDVQRQRSAAWLAGAARDGRLLYLALSAP
jgi:hypothetical protein